MHQLRYDYLTSDKHEWQLDLLSLKKFYVLHHITFITACAENVLLQHERKRRTMRRISNSMFNNVRPIAAH